MSDTKEKISAGLLSGFVVALVILLVVYAIVNEDFSKNVFDRLSTRLRIVSGR